MFSEKLKNWINSQIYFNLWFLLRGMRLGYRREFLHELKQLLPPWNFVPFIFFVPFCTLPLFCVHYLLTKNLVLFTNFTASCDKKKTKPHRSWWDAALRSGATFLGQISAAQRLPPKQIISWSSVVASLSRSLLWLEPVILKPSWTLDLRAPHAMRSGKPKLQRTYRFRLFVVLLASSN